MNIEAIPIGDNPPEDINVIIEVPIGGEPIKYEMNKKAEALHFAAMQNLVAIGDTADIKEAAKMRHAPQQGAM